MRSAAADVAVIEPMNSELLFFRNELSGEIPTVLSLLTALT
jgi:hypothetical protein